MKRFAWMSITLCMLLLYGCANKDGEEPLQEKIVYRPSDADAVLTCLSTNEKMTRKEFKKVFADANAQAAGGQDMAVQRQICLSLHPYASYRQFKGGMELLIKYLKDHPDHAGSLKGLMQLMQRIDREKASRWVQSSKNMDEKEELEEENRDLAARNERLEKSLAQEQARNRELQKQIEQLKNIENIIKAREH